MAEILKNIALIGASGNLGSATLKAILSNDKHNLTVITRPSSTTAYPSSITVKKGEYKDAGFLESALRGQDVLIIMLGFGGLSAQRAIFAAAAKAGVKYVLPSEYGAPSGNDKHVKAVPILQVKRDDHEFIEKLGMKWIAVASNSWIDYSLQYGVFDILAPERKATIYTDSASFVTTSIPQVAAAIASLLCLDRSAIDKEFANNYLYVSSFVLTHPEIFSAVLRVTGTKEEDWEVQKKPVQDLIDEGWRMVNAGELAGHFKIIYGVTYLKGMGGNYSDLVHNKRLGLPQEDLDTVVRAAVDAAKPGGWSAGSTLAL